MQIPAYFKIDILPFTQAFREERKQVTSGLKYCLLRHCRNIFHIIFALLLSTGCPIIFPFLFDVCQINKVSMQA